MPYLPDEEDEKALALGGGGSTGGGPAMRGATGTAAQATAAPAAGRESGGGFVNLQRILGLNQTGAQSMAGGMLGASQEIQRNAQDATSGARATDYAKSLTSQGGREAAARGLYGPHETGGDAGFDAFLSGQAGGNVFNTNAQQASDLERVLGQPNITGPRVEPDNAPNLAQDVDDAYVSGTSRRGGKAIAPEGGKPFSVRTNPRFDGY